MKQDYNMKKILFYTIISTSLLVMWCKTSTWLIDQGTGEQNSGVVLSGSSEEVLINEYKPDNKIGSVYVWKNKIYKIYFDNTYWKLDNQSEFAPSDFVFYNQDETLSAVVFTDESSSGYDAYVKQELDRYSKVWSWYTLLKTGSWKIDKHVYVDIQFENIQDDLKIANRVVIIKLEDRYMNIIFVTESIAYDTFAIYMDRLIEGISLD